MNCDCDYDSPEFYNCKEVIAKKEHICSECGSPILIGEKYENVFGKWGGVVATFKTCSDCLNLRFALETTPCYCLVHGSLIDDFTCAISDCWKFSYSVKDIKHRQSWIELDIKEEYENWQEMRKE